MALLYKRLHKSHSIELLVNKSAMLERQKIREIQDANYVLLYQPSRGTH